MIKAIIFDLWGTLCESEGIMHPFEEFARHIGMTYNNPLFNESFEGLFMTKKVTDLRADIQLFLKQVNIPITPDLINELEIIYLKNGTTIKKAFPEMIETMQLLRKKYKIAILSNTTNIAIPPLTKRYPLAEMFDVITYSYEIGRIKPDPRIYEYTLQKLGVSKDEVIMVGDSVRNDIKGATDFGIKSVLIDRKGKNPDYPNRIISLTELPTLLEQM